MKKLVFFVLVLSLFSCKKEVAYPPVGQSVKNDALKVSKDRARNLNAVERRLIEEWIKNQKETFSTMPLNYWVNKSDFSSREKSNPAKVVSYLYFMYDFDGNQVYSEPKGFRDIPLGKVDDIRVVQDALQYMQTGEEVTLLTPSVLAYGTRGDGNKIVHDIPLLIKLKIVQ